MGTNKILIFSATILLLLTILVLSTGGVRDDVILNHYELSTDGVTMILKVKTNSKLGNVRKIDVKKEGNDVFIKFYSSFGFNSRLGTNDTYNVDIVNIDEIFFYVGKKGYKKVLELRNKKWQEPYDDFIVNKNI